MINDLVYSTQIENSDYLKSMKNLFALMDIKENEEIKKISIKINLCDYRMPESGAVTDPIILETLIRNIEYKFPNALIFITESDASGTKVETLFDVLDLHRLEENHNCKLVNLTRSDWIKKTINGRIFKEIYIPKLYEESDLIINHPKMKTHSLTKMTCCLKNIFGCMKDKYKVKYHDVIDDVIVDLNKAIKVDLCFVDANICHEGFNGPTYGTPKRCGLMIGGYNGVSVDSFCANLMGFQSNSVSHIKKCNKYGVGNINYRLVTDISQFDINSYSFKFDSFRYSLMNIFRDAL